MTTETAAEFHIRAQAVMAAMGNPTTTPTTTPLTTAADPARENFQALMEKARTDLLDLRRPDGTPRHTPTEMTERRENIRASVTAALTEYDTPLIEAQAAVQAELAALTEYDPGSILADLSTEELTRANGLSAFIKEDVSSLSAEALAPAIEAAINRNDRPALALYLRELPRRTETIGKELKLSDRIAWAKLENAIKTHVTPPDDGTRAKLQARHTELTLARSAAVRAADPETPSIKF